MLNCEATLSRSPEDPTPLIHENVNGEVRVPHFLMAGPKHTLVVQSVQETVQLPAAEPHALKAEMSRIESRTAPGYWVGALPFDNAEPCYLLRPQFVKKSTTWSPFPRTTTKPDTRRIESASHRNDYQRFVEKALVQIAHTQLEKVVLAQSTEYLLDRAPHIPTLLGELRRRNPEGTTYGMKLPGETKNKMLVGSSPELLVSKYNGQVRCLPLAGSRRRSSDPLTDQKLQEELLDSTKDKEEHAFLVDQLLSDLAPWVEDLVFLQEPQTISTSTMWHLATPIVGRVKSHATTSLDLAMALHPSAAVCGVPRQNALETIHQVESMPRGFYAGALGAMDENGDGEWIVTIRGAELEDNRVRIFSGAGIIAGSSPELEYQETEDKKQTMLQAIAAATR